MENDMYWVKIFDLKEVPKRKSMLFWDGNNWYTGQLIDDEEYGMVICVDETYVPADRVTHYMMVKLP